METIKRYPYLAALLGFSAMVAWGLFKLSAMLAPLQS